MITTATPWPEPLHPRLHDHLVSPDRHSHALCARPAALPAVPVTWEAQDTQVGRAWVPVAAPTTELRTPSWAHIVAALIWVALHLPRTVREVTPVTPATVSRPEWQAHTWTIGTAELRHAMVRWTADYATAPVGAQR